MAKRLLLQWKKWQSPRKKAEVEQEDDASYNDDPNKELQTLLSSTENQAFMISAVGPLLVEEWESMFKIWQADTNFPITTSMEKAICSLPGVEGFDPLTRYKFRLVVGQMFCDEEVKEKVYKIMKKYAGRRKKAG